MNYVQASDARPLDVYQFVSSSELPVLSFQHSGRIRLLLPTSEPKCQAKRSFPGPQHGVGLLNFWADCMEADRAGPLESVQNRSTDSIRHGAEQVAHMVHASHYLNK